MKNFLLIGSIMVSLSLLIVLYAVPAFAHGPGGYTDFADSGTWESMYQACRDGDLDAMLEGAGEVHEDYSGYIPCFDYDEGSNSPDSEGSPSAGRCKMGYQMGGGMMGWR